MFYRKIVKKLVNKTLIYVSCKCYTILLKKSYFSVIKSKCCICCMFNPDLYLILYKFNAKLSLLMDGQIFSMLYTTK